MPPKKKEKGKGKGKEKAEKKTGETESDPSEDLPKPPTQKEVFETLIQNLTQELELADLEHTKQKDALEHFQKQLNAEIDDKKQCVAHLEIQIREQCKRRAKVQDVYQHIQYETMGYVKRSEEVLSDLARKMKANQSERDQEKFEMKERLSSLKDRRDRRNTQNIDLKRLQEQWEHKIEAIREDSRKTNIAQVERLLKNQEAFWEKCRRLREEWQEAFRVRMPVQIKKQFFRNMQLKEEKGKTVDKLLQLQEKNVSLQEQQKILDLKHEFQSASEEDANKRQIAQDEELRHLLQIRKDLQCEIIEGTEKASELRFSKNPENGNTVLSEDKISLAEEEEKETSDFLKTTSSEFVDTCLKDDKIFLLMEEELARRAYVTENEVCWKTQTLRETAIKQYQLVDRFVEMDRILKDQIEFEWSLEEQINKNQDRNGVMMSAILRAGKIFETRCGKLVEESDIDLDYDVLQQMQMLLIQASKEVQQNM